MTKQFSYDPACEVLARHFIEDDAADGEIRALAQTIQDAVEDWMEGWMNDGPPDGDAWSGGFAENH